MNRIRALLQSALVFPSVLIVTSALLAQPSLKGLLPAIGEKVNKLVEVSVKGPFTPKTAKLDETVKSSFGISYTDLTIREEAQTKGIRDQYFLLDYGSGGGVVATVRVIGKLSDGKPFDHSFKNLKLGETQTNSDLKVTLRKPGSFVTITGGAASPVITAIEPEGKYTTPGEKTITLFAGIRPQGAPIRGTDIAHTSGIVVAQGEKPAELKKKGSKKGAKGTLTWEIKAKDAKGKGVDADFEWTSDKDGCPCTVITYIQVVTRLTLGDMGFQPGGNEDEEYYKKWSVDQKLSDRIDHIRGENDPYYGAMFDEIKKKWVSELGPGMIVGNGPPTVKAATAQDETFAGAGRDKDLGVFINTFEMAVFCVDSQEVLGVIKWGYKVPANETDPLEILFADEKDFSLSLSDAAKKTIAKANQIGKNDLMKHAQLDGSPLISKPNGKLKCGGTSALPD